MTAWETLGVPWGSSTEECRAAWLTLSKEHHPDKGGSPEKLDEITKAYRQLTGAGRGRYMTLTCGTCKGAGWVKKMQGWSMVDAPCECTKGNA